MTALTIMARCTICCWLGAVLRVGTHTSSTKSVAALLSSELNELNTAPSSTARNTPIIQTGRRSCTSVGKARSMEARPGP